MAAKWLRILLVLLVGFGLLSAGCGKVKTEPPPTPEVVAVDVPGDDGLAVRISWRHYASTPAVKYEVLRGTDESSVDSIIAEISAQISVPAVDTSSLNVFAEFDYYLIVDENTEPPKAHIVQASPETKDSIAAIGEHIQKVEMTVVANDVDELPMKYIDTDVYLVNPMEKFLTETQAQKLEKLALSGDSLIASDKDNSLTLQISEEEKAYILKGRTLRHPGEDDDFFVKKFGQAVYSIVTDKARYAREFSGMQVMDNDTTHLLTTGTKYFYKVRAYIKGGKEGIDSKIVEATPIDDKPSPPEIANAIYDKKSGDLIINWAVRDADLRKVSIFATTEDSLVGKELATVNPSWTNIKLQGIVKDSTQTFYIEATDSFSTVKSEVFSPRPVDFASVEMLQDLKVIDHPNDEGLAIDILWEPPALGLSISAIPTESKTIKTEVNGNLYFLNNEIVVLEDSIPDNARKILAYSTIKKGQVFDVNISYDMMTNTEHQAGFASLNITGNNLDETQIDYDALGKFTFRGLPAGEYKINSTLKDINGNDFANSEASIEHTVVLGSDESLDPPLKINQIQIFRTIADEDVPEKNEFELFAQQSTAVRAFVDRWAKDQEGQYRELTSHKYAYFLRIIGSDGNFTDSEIFGPIKPASNYFHKEKLIIAIFIAVFFGIAGFYLIQGKKGKTYFVRPIAGIDHIDEALGRATEMGKPILYVMGLGSLGDLPTLASMTILGRVAKKAAEYQNRLIVPACDPIVMLVAQETVRSAYIDAGRPDAYNENDIYYITRSQFSYAAAVSGIMMREKTATHFFMGWFAAESLILAETGSRSGAIQIAGTDAVSQLPFFITSCDYTLMGEELYAASAYMSGDPIQISALRIQDTLKAIYALLMLLGTIAISSNILWFVNIFKVNLEQ